MSTINAAVLDLRLKYLEEYIAKRNQNAKLYQNILDSKKIKFQFVLPKCKSSWRNFSIRLKNRNEIYSQLYDKKIRIALGYYQ